MAKLAVQSQIQLVEYKEHDLASVSAFVRIRIPFLTPEELKEKEKETAKWGTLNKIQKQP